MTALVEAWSADAGDWVRMLRAAPDGARLAVGTAAGEVLVLAMASGEILWRQKVLAGAVMDLGWSPRGDRLVVAGEEDAARIVMASDGAIRAELPGRAAWVEHAAWSSTGEFVAAASGPVVRIFDAEGNPHLETEDHESTIAAMQWSGDGSRIATASYGGLHVWAVAAGAKSRNFPWKGSLISLAWSPGGKVIACGTQECAVRFWRLSSGSASEMNGYPQKPRSLAWDSRGRWLATGGAPIVLIWDFSGRGPEGTRPIQLAGHEEIVTELVFAPDAKRFVSGARDGSLLLWEPGRAKKSIARAQLAGEVTGVVWDGDGKRLYAAGADGFVRELALV
jgi:WD40 repeat protein